MKKFKFINTLSLVLFAMLILAACTSNDDPQITNDPTEYTEVYEDVITWEQEVEETIGDFISSVENVEVRVSEQIFNLFLGYTWTVEFYDSASSVELAFLDSSIRYVMTHDGIMISTSIDGQGRYEHTLSEVPMTAVNLIRFTWVLEEELNFNFENEQNSSDDGIYDFRFEFEDTDTHLRNSWNLVLLRNLDEDTPENRTFLDEVRLETERINGIATTGWLEITRSADFMQSGRVDYYSSSLVAFNLYGTDLEGNVFSADPSGWLPTVDGFHRRMVGFYNRTPNDENFLTELLAEAECQADPECIIETAEQPNAPSVNTGTLSGTWVRFGDGYETHITITGNELTFGMIGQGGYGIGGGVSTFTLSEDSRYIIATALVGGGLDGNVGFSLSENMLVIDGTASADGVYLRYGSELYNTERSAQ